MTSTHRTFGASLGPRTMRLVASVAVGVVVALGATGCSFAAEISTAVPYSPSDGINVRNEGPVSVLNALFVVDAEDEGAVANFVGAIVNSSESDATLTMQVGEGADAVSQTIRVKANGVVSFGSEDEGPLLIPDFEAEPGSTVPVFFQSGDAEGTIGNVPVLDGQFTYLSTLVPTPTPTATR